MAELVVEARDAHRRILALYPVDHFPLAIGRGYDNDIILSDPHVCPRHLLVEPDEHGWRAQDLESVNGLSGNGASAPEIHLDSGDEIIIGKTHLCFYSPDHPVAATRNVHEKTGLREAARAMAIVWALLSLLVLGFAFNDYLTITTQVQVEKLIAGTLPVVAAVFIWAGGWSLLAYIVRRRLHFYYFLGVSVAYVLLDMLLESVIGVVAFNIVNSWILEALSYFTGGVLLVALFYASMHQAFAISSRRKLVLANLFSWGLIAMVVFVVYANKPDFDRNPEYPAELKPPVMRIASLEKFDVFMNDTETMLKEFDNQVKEQ